MPFRWAATTYSPYLGTTIGTTGIAKITRWLTPGTASREASFEAEVQRVAIDLVNRDHQGVLFIGLVPWNQYANSKGNGDRLG